MRVFLDACIDPRTARVFANHEVTTAFELRWHQLKDRILLSHLHGKIDVFVTTDQGFEHQHNLKKLSFGILIVHVPKNKLEFYQLIESKLLSALVRVKTGHILHVYTEDRDERA